MSSTWKGLAIRNGYLRAQLIYGYKYLDNRIRQKHNWSEARKVKNALISRNN